LSGGHIRFWSSPGAQSLIQAIVAGVALETEREWGKKTGRRGRRQAEAEVEGQGARAATY